jgi:aspartyl protease family protein
VKFLGEPVMDVLKSAAIISVAAVAAGYYISHSESRLKLANLAPAARSGSGLTFSSKPEAPAAPMRSGATAVLTQDRSGHYFARVESRGVTLNMVVDTGATLVSLTAEDARALGIYPLSSDYNIPTMTANGKAFSARVKLDMVRIEGVLVYDVDALVAQPGAQEISLLGMSFLRKLASYQAEQGRLVLHQ